jgi:hypothetical protein
LCLMASSLARSSSRCFKAEGDVTR